MLRVKIAGNVGSRWERTGERRNTGEYKAEEMRLGERINHPTSRVRIKASAAAFLLTRRDLEV